MVSANGRIKTSETSLHWEGFSFFVHLEMRYLLYIPSYRHHKAQSTTLGKNWHWNQRSVAQEQKRCTNPANDVFSQYALAPLTFWEANLGSTTKQTGGRGSHFDRVVIELGPFLIERKTMPKRVQLFAMPPWGKKTLQLKVWSERTARLCVIFKTAVYTEGPYAGPRSFTL